MNAMSAQGTPRHFGVDGCKGGWFYLCLSTDAPQYGFAPHISEILEQATEADTVFIDIPIGLLDAGPAARRCDVEARQLLGVRAASVFNAPVRGVLSQQRYAEANALSREVSGKGLSKQSWNLCAKIREVDSILQTDAEARRILREAHPELCFLGLAGGTPMLHNKKTEEGFHERLALLERYWPAAGACVAAALASYPRARVARDDIVDAAVCALTASLQPHWRALPATAEHDATGLAMQIMYCQP